MQGTGLQLGGTQGGLQLGGVQSTGLGGTGLQLGGGIQSTGLQLGGGTGLQLGLGNTKPTSMGLSLAGPSMKGTYVCVTSLL